MAVRVSCLFTEHLVVYAVKQFYAPQYAGAVSSAYWPLVSLILKQPAGCPVIFTVNNTIITAADAGVRTVGIV